MSVWSPVELFPSDKLKEYQFNRLKLLLDSANQKELYKRKFAEHGVDIRQIRSIDDIAKLPFSDKADLVTGFEDGSFTVAPEHLYRWHQTSGTTGQPVRVPDNQESWSQYCDVAAAAVYGMGVRKDDVVMVCFGYGPFIAFWTYIGALDIIGSCFVPSGALTSAQRVKMIADYNVTALFCTPTYALQLAEQSRQMGADLSKHLRLTLHTGEPCPPLMKKKLREAFGIRPMDRFGTTEAGGIAFECPHTTGIYHLHESHLVAEILDPETKIPVEPGQMGELIITPLYRRKVPVIRFRTENLVKRASIDRCVCGRTMLSLEETSNGVVAQRLDNLIKVRGVLINPTLIGGILSECRNILEYQVVLQRRNISEDVTVRVEYPSGLEGSSDALRSELESTLKEKLLIRCEVELVEPGTLPRYEEKAKRIVDLRTLRS